MKDEDEGRALVVDPLRVRLGAGEALAGGASREEDVRDLRMLVEDVHEQLEPVLDEGEDGSDGPSLVRPLGEDQVSGALGRLRRQDRARGRLGLEHDHLDARPRAGRDVQRREGVIAAPHAREKVEDEDVDVAMISGGDPRPVALDRRADGRGRGQGGLNPRLNPGAIGDL